MTPPEPDARPDYFSPGRLAARRCPSQRCGGGRPVPKALHTRSPFTEPDIGYRSLEGLSRGLSNFWPCCQLAGIPGAFQGGVVFVRRPRSVPASPGRQPIVSSSPVRSGAKVGRAGLGQLRRVVGREQTAQLRASAATPTIPTLRVARLGTCFVFR